MPRLLLSRNSHWSKIPKQLVWYIPGWEAFSKETPWTSWWGTCPPGLRLPSWETPVSFSRPYFHFKKFTTRTITVLVVSTTSVNLLRAWTVYLRHVLFEFLTWSSVITKFWVWLFFSYFIFSVMFRSFVFLHSTTINFATRIKLDS